MKPDQPLRVIDTSGGGQNLALLELLNEGSPLAHTLALRLSGRPVKSMLSHINHTAFHDTVSHALTLIPDHLAAQLKIVPLAESKNSSARPHVTLVGPNNHTATLDYVPREEMPENAKGYQASGYNFSSHLGRTDTTQEILLSAGLGHSKLVDTQLYPALCAFAQLEVPAIATP